MLSRRKLLKLAAPALILPSRFARAGFNIAQASTPAKYTFPVAMDATKTFFVDQNHNPCFGCGDAPQYIMEQLGTADVESYLRDRASRGINILWMIAADKLYQSNPPNNVFGNAPFSGTDFTNFQSPYWNYVDYVMQRALVYGQTVLLMPAFIGLSDTQGYHSDFYTQTDAVLQNYASFLGNRYNTFQNLIWLLGGDADPNNATSYAKLNTFAVALKAADPGHLMTLEASRFLDGPGAAAPNGGYSSVDAHTIAYGSVQSWLDINWVYQTGPTVTSGAQRCYRQGSLPNLLGEDWYELEHSETSLGLRTEAYGAVLGGCTLGRLFGNGVIWPFNSTSAVSGNVQSPTWQSQLSSSGSVGQQLLGALFRSRAFQKLVPDLTNVVMTVGSSNGSICARTSDGQTVIAYLPSSQTVTFDMSKITDAGSQAVAHWFDPSTGAVRNAGTFANSGSQSFTSPPDLSDAVLVIDSVAANLRPPGT